MRSMKNGGDFTPGGDITPLNLMWPQSTGDVDSRVDSFGVQVGVKAGLVIPDGLRVKDVLDIPFLSCCLVIAVQHLLGSRHP